MKNNETVKIVGPLPPAAIRVVRDLPGISVSTQPGRGDTGADVVLHFAWSQLTVAVEFKRRVDAAIAWQIARSATERSDVPLVLIAEETTADARAILTEHNVSVLDGLGNAYIKVPGLLVRQEGSGRRSRHRTTRPIRLGGKAGVVAEALMLDPARAWRVTELAERASVSTGLTHRVLTRLEAQHLVASEGRGPQRLRRVTDPTGLLDLWAEEQSGRYERRLGHLLAQSPRQLIDRLSANLSQAGITYALTGAAGASLIAPFATTVPVVQAWVSAHVAPEDLYDAADAEEVRDGANIILLQADDDLALAFREQINDSWVANRFRLYSDLRRDPRRGREQAQYLREEVIGW